MQKTTIVSALVAIVILFSSCMNKEQKKQMGQIDSLRNTLDTISRDFNSLDSTQIAENFNQLLSNNDAFDSIPEENVNKELISRHREAERNLRRYMVNYDRLKSELNKGYNQLDSLSYDVKNDVIPEGKFKFYFDDEEQVVGRLREMTDYIVTTSEKELKRYDSLQTAVDKYLEKNNIQTEE
ncbi:MAG: hypothetical protein ACQESM_03830 [Bacteroidota bacterium]